MGRPLWWSRRLVAVALPTTEPQKSKSTKAVASTKHFRQFID